MQEHLWHSVSCNIAVVINGLHQVVIGHNTTKSLHVFTVTLNSASTVLLLSIKMASCCIEKTHQYMLITIFNGTGTL